MGMHGNTETEPAWRGADEAARQIKAMKARLEELTARQAAAEDAAASPAKFLTAGFLFLFLAAPLFVVLLLSSDKNVLWPGGFILWMVLAAASVNRFANAWLTAVRARNTWAASDKNA